jgi:dimeric dUTPase (all-alpha-NTP-PPase superfamily)
MECKLEITICQLSLAAYNGELEKIKSSLHSYLYIPKEKEMALLQAIRANHIECVHFLRSLVPDYLDVPLVVAADSGNEVCVKLFLELGATSQEEALKIATDPTIIKLLSHHKPIASSSSA